MKVSENQVVMPLNIAVMIEKNDPVFKMQDYGFRCFITRRKKNNETRSQ